MGLARHPFGFTIWRQAIIESVEAIRFWTTRLHGPEALYVETAHHVARAADHIAVGDENSAQLALDTIGLDRLSPDGAALISAVAKRLEVPRPDWPVRPGPRFWETDDIMQQAAFFEEFFDRTARLAKVIPFDPLKHPRWPDGAPESQGGRFAPAGGADFPPLVEVQYRGQYHDQFVDYLVNLSPQGGGIAIKSVPLTTVSGLTCIADALIKPAGKPPFILEVKTGKEPTFTFSQAPCYPWAVIGYHVTSIKPAVAKLGLIPGAPFPPIEVVVMRATAPGRPFFGNVIRRDNLEELLMKWIGTSGFSGHCLPSMLFSRCSTI